MEKKSLRDLINTLDEHGLMLEVLPDLDAASRIILSDITNSSASARVEKAFFAIRGSVKDGHSFIKDAIENGCRVIVCQRIPDAKEIKNAREKAAENNGEKISEAKEIIFVKVTDSARAWAIAAHWHFGFPAREMTLVGVTGTNGKTTIATSIFAIWKNIGKACGLISTIENRIQDLVLHTEHTTPDAYDIAKLFYMMKEKKVTHVVMEVSSHALAQERVAGLIFKVGIFTNLTQDHLDFHETMDTYAAEKKKLFSHYIDPNDPNSLAIINADDQYGNFMANGLKCRTALYGTKSLEYGSYRIDNVELGLMGSRWTISGQKAESRLVGLFNVYNMTAVALAINASAERDIFQSIALLKSIMPPKGRCEIVHAENPMIVVDYAHTPDGLEKILETMRAILPSGKKLVAVFGCGGNRDTTKRPKMGAIAARLADIVIVTSDNPRKEDPLLIISDIKAGILGHGGAIAGKTGKEKDKDKKKSADKAPAHLHAQSAGHDAHMRATDVQYIPDRAEAIRFAIRQYPNDVVLIAGKGHEDYQIIGTDKIHFSDQEEALKALSA